MIKKYIEFLKESYQLILESDVVYSDRMRMALSRIDNPIAKHIIGMENKDLPVKSNFFDILIDANDKVSFIPDRKAQEILSDTKEVVRFTGSGGGWLKHKETNKSIFDKLGYTYEEGKSPYEPGSRDIGEVVSDIKSATSGREYAWVKFKERETGKELGEGVYNREKLVKIDERQKLVWSKNRQDIKVGKAIKALLDTDEFKFTPAELEQFVNQFKATVDKLNDKFSYFDLVDGEEIGYWYSSKNYYMSRGTLGTSCMANSPVSFFDIYINNPKVCSLLILKSKDDNDLIIGRALLWTLRDGKRFMDRVYTISDSDVQLFRDYAKENGWYSKSNNNSSDSGYAFDPKTGDVIDLGTLIVDVKSGPYDKYPYMDTIKYYSPSRGTLSTSASDDSLTLEDTGGGHTSCDSCDGSGRQTCYDCDGDGTLECGRCDGDGSEDCEECDGNAEVDCPDCSGEGTVENGEEEVDCSRCSASGTIECEECDGEGSRECSRCDGEGSEECSNCYGDGAVDCYECN